MGIQKLNYGGAEVVREVKAWTVPEKEHQRDSVEHILSVEIKKLQCRENKREDSGKHWSCDNPADAELLWLSTLGKI
jgi:hypothetical protein